MLVIKSKVECTGCNTCVLVCPQNCIEMQADEEGFLYPYVDGSKCVKCGICEKKCPVISPVLVNSDEEDIVAYAAKIKDEKIRIDSSSGGIFSVLSDWVIENGGVVFGAAFDSEFQVRHIAVQTKKELEKLRGSKYVQSIMGTSYKEVEEFLCSGRIVLFTGTPCQIGGLYKFLKHDYANLYTQDIICHGVPSAMVWKRYIEYLETKAASKLQRMFFRHKKYGWKKFSVRFEFENHTEYQQIHSEDLYMQGFLADLCLRPSCYDCKFKQKNRQGDFTLADFWGIQNIMPEMDDDKGTSLVVLHSSKAKSLFDSLATNMIYKRVDLDKAIVYNSAMVKACKRPQNRDLFMRQIQNESFEKAIKRNITKENLFIKVIRKVRKMVSSSKQGVFNK